MHAVIPEPGGRALVLLQVGWPAHPRQTAALLEQLMATPHGQLSIGPEMLILFGVWVAVAGGVAALAGLAGLHRVRRLRRDGVTAWALAVPRPEPADPQPTDPDRRLRLRYTLADGQVVERIAPVPDRRSGTPRPGDKVLIWYDPADPDDALVFGHWGRAGNRAFLIAGLLLILAGTVIAVAGH